MVFNSCSAPAQTAVSLQAALRCKMHEGKSPGHGEFGEQLAEPRELFHRTHACSLTQHPKDLGGLIARARGERGVPGNRGQSAVSPPQQTSRQLRHDRGPQ
jgi:hypothetical protein